MVVVVVMAAEATEMALLLILLEVVTTAVVEVVLATWDMAIPSPVTSRMALIQSHITAAEVLVGEEPIHLGVTTRNPLLDLHVRLDSVMLVLVALALELGGNLAAWEGAGSVGPAAFHLEEGRVAMEDLGVWEDTEEGLSHPVAEGVYLAACSLLAPISTAAEAITETCPHLVLRQVELARGAVEGDTMISTEAVEDQGSLGIIGAGLLEVEDTEDLGGCRQTLRDLLEVMGHPGGTILTARARGSMEVAQAIDVTRLLAVYCKHLAMSHCYQPHIIHSTFTMQCCKISFFNLNF